MQPSLQEVSSAICGFTAAVRLCISTLEMRALSGSVRHITAQMWREPRAPPCSPSSRGAGSSAPPGSAPPRSPWERPAWRASKGLGERTDSGKGTGDDSPWSRAAQRESSTWCCPLQPFPVALCCSARWQRRGRCPLTCLGIGPWLLSPGAPQQPGCVTAQDGLCSHLLEPHKVADLHMGLHG